MSLVAVSSTADNLPVPASDQAPIVLPSGEPLPGPVPGRPRRGTSTIGTLIGTPAITVSVVVCASPPMIGATSVLVPPMSKVRRSL